MVNANLQLIHDFITDTEPLIKYIDELPKETVIELYSMHRPVAKSKSATLNITQIDPEYCVVLCDRLDRILERIIDLNISSKYTNIRGIYTPAVHSYRRWGNVELLKDKCLTGYMLANELGAHSVMMFGTNPIEYPYMKLLPRLEILFTDAESGNPYVYFKHLHKEHHKMDVLILHGIYNETSKYLDAYRKYRPDGIVYCSLDLNSYWMGRIDWGSSTISAFSKQCDMITTSCRALRDELNRSKSVSFPCQWLPYGFYNPLNTSIIADASKKKNIILTVGRIGAKTKRSGELLVAFAKACDILKDWELRLVGPIESDFMPFIVKYFDAFPYLKDRVIFTGAISDKEVLYREYAQAKLFAITSQSEGGAPNVYSEALVHGCMFVTSDIDAADEITNHGNLGIKYKRGDTDGLADAIIKLSKKVYHEHLQLHISKALEYAGKYYDWERNAKKLAYMLLNV